MVFGEIWFKLILLKYRGIPGFFVCSQSNFNDPLQYEMYSS